jgi:hypothetical protein
MGKPHRKEGAENHYLNDLPEPEEEMKREPTEMFNRDDYDTI